MNITTSAIINKEAYDAIVGMLVEYNESKTQYQNYINKPIEILIKGDDGGLIGGLYGRSIWGTLEVKTLAVHSKYRSKGIGGKLMLAAEKEARNRKCKFISLDTFSFQAPKFYEKLGFKRIGVETNFPEVEEKYYYRKELK